MISSCSADMQATLGDPQGGDLQGLSESRRPTEPGSGIGAPMLVVIGAKAQPPCHVMLAEAHINLARSNPASGQETQPRDDHHNGRDCDADGPVGHHEAADPLSRSSLAAARCWRLASFAAFRSAAATPRAIARYSASHWRSRSAAIAAAFTRRYAAVVEHRWAARGERCVVGHWPWLYRGVRGRRCLEPVAP